MSTTLAEEQAKAFLDGAAGVVCAVAGVQREFVQRFAPAFNPVTLIAGEVGWSKLLRMLLDPNGPHGQGDVFLQAFLRIVRAPGDLTGSVRARVEVPLGEDAGRADILIEWSDPPGFACLIENKLGAADQPEQLERYAAWLSRKYPGRWRMAYVSLYGGPTTRSISSSELKRHTIEGRLVLVPYGGKQSLQEWLAETRRSCVAERVRPFVDWMDEAITRMGSTMNEVDPLTGALESYIISSPASVELARQVTQALEQVRNRVSCQLAETIVTMLMAERSDLISENHDGLLRDSRQGYHSFILLRRPGWHDRVWISLSAAPSSDPWLFGIAYDKEDALTKDEQSSLFSIAKDALPDWHCKKNSWWAWMTAFPEPLTRPSSTEGLTAALAGVGRAGFDRADDVRRSAVEALNRIVAACVQLVDVADAWSHEHAPPRPPASTTLPG